MKQHFLFINEFFRNPIGSIETSMLQRCDIFKQYLNINPIYVCTGFDSEQPIYLKKLKK